MKAGRNSLAALALFAGLSGSACRSAPPAAPTPPSGFLMLEIAPAEAAPASVLVDDRPLLRRGGGGPLRVALPAGAHRLEVYAPGYFHAYKDIAVAAPTETRLKVLLRADPDAAASGSAGLGRAFGPELGKIWQ